MRFIHSLHDYLEVGVQIGALKNIANLTRKHLCWSLQACQVFKKRLQDSCLLVKFANFLRTAFYAEYFRLRFLALHKFFFVLQ